jgi:leucyl/phenylalanyl-tRNA--protein transferase
VIEPAVPVSIETDEPPFWLPPHLGDESGLIGIGGNLRPETLLAAYRDGVFPWFSDGDPILWFSPEPRGIIPLDGFHVPKRLMRTMKQGRFAVSYDRAFAEVMVGCGENRDDGTWITDEMLAAYIDLHRLGHAHSVEVWQGDQLVGGTYGVAVNGLFAAESMFHRVTDASKVALVALWSRLVDRGFVLWDIQMVSDHTARFGGVEIPRRDYLKALQIANGVNCQFA